MRVKEPQRAWHLIAMDIREASCVSHGRLRRHPWELARLEVIHSLLLDFSSDIFQRRGTILDIGCGDGFVISELAARYPDTRFVGVDDALRPEMVQGIQVNLPFSNVELYDSLDRIQYGSESFDVVLFLDVLEHIEDDMLFLKSLLCHNSVPNGGCIITVPAFQRLFSSRDYFLNHFRRYSCQRLLLVVSEAGIEVMQHGYFFFSLLFPRLAQVLLEKSRIVRFGAGTSVSHWTGPAFADGILKRTLLYDFYVSRWLHKHGFLLPGLSCYVIGKK